MLREKVRIVERIHNVLEIINKLIIKVKLIDAYHFLRKVEKFVIEGEMNELMDEIITYKKEIEKKKKREREKERENYRNLGIDFL